MSPQGARAPAAGSAALRVSLRLNNDLPSDRFLELAVAAEESGFFQLWVSHDLLLRSAPVLLSAAAGVTNRIQLGAGVLNPYSAHPVELAMHAATLQEVSGGRALLGIGAGAAGLLAAAGIERPGPLERTREAIGTCRSLLRGAPGGRPSVVTSFPVPVPLYLGAMGPRMLALAGELADGALALLYPPEHYPLARAQVLSAAEAVGRSSDELDLPACVWVSVDEDPEAAQGALAEKFAFYGQDLSPYLLGRTGLRPADFAPAASALAGGEQRLARSLVTPAMLRLGIAGTPDEVATRCAALLEAGATHLSFGPPLGPDPVRAVQTIAREVVPALEQAALRPRATAGATPCRPSSEVQT